MSEIPPQVVDAIYKHWYNKIIPFVLVLLSTITLLCQFIKDDINELSTIELAIIVIIDFIIVLIWISTTRIPHCPANKIGIGIAINCDTKELHEKIYSDFISNFSNLLNINNKKYLFHVIEFSERISKGIRNTDDAFSILNKSDSRYLLYGNCKKRVLDGKEQYLLNYNVAISHKPISVEISKKISKEIAEIYPRRMRIDTKNDVLSFEATSEWIYYLTRYTLGLAAYISNADDYAEILFRDTINEPAVQKTKFPTLRKIKISSEQRLADILADKAAIKYGNWTKNKTELELLKEIFVLTNEIKSISENHYKGNLLSAICKFILNKDVDGAIRDLELCRYVHYDLTWRMSLAFLFAYNGNLEMATKHYERALKGVFQPHVSLDCEEFIIEVLEKEPDKIQFYFCLGLINFKIKEDFALAKKYFQLFIDAAEKQRVFEKEKELAKIYIEEISSKFHSTEN